MLKLSRKLALSRGYNANIVCCVYLTIRPGISFFFPSVTFTAKTTRAEIFLDSKWGAAYHIKAYHFCLFFIRTA